MLSARGRHAAPHRLSGRADGNTWASDSFAWQVGRLAALRGRFNSFTPFHQRGFTRHAARRRVHNARNILSAACRSAAAANSAVFLKTVRGAARHAWHTRGSDCSSVDECYFRRGVSHLPGLAHTPSRLSRINGGKGERGRLSREWPDVSPARLCLTPRIFPLNFPDARIYHRLHLAEKPRSTAAGFAQPRSDSHYDRHEIPWSAYRAARAYAITSRRHFSGSANVAVGLFWYTYTRISVLEKLKEHAGKAYQ